MLECAPGTKRELCLGDKGGKKNFPFWPPSSDRPQSGLKLEPLPFSYLHSKICVSLTFLNRKSASLSRGSSPLVAHWGNLREFNFNYSLVSNSCFLLLRETKLSRFTSGTFIYYAFLKFTPNWPQQNLEQRFDQVCLKIYLHILWCKFLTVNTNKMEYRLCLKLGTKHTKHPGMREIRPTQRFGLNIKDGSAVASR